MGRDSYRKLASAALIAAGVLLTFQVAASASSITFPAPREASVRHSGGTLLRGGLKSMTDDEVVVATTRGDKSVALSTVSSVIAADGSFKFYPMQETFDEFLAKSAGIRGATIVRDGATGGTGGASDTKMIGTVSDGYARSVGMQPPGTPRAGSSGGGFVQSDGFAGASQRPQGLARLEAPVIAELDAKAVEEFKQEKQAQAQSGQGFALPGGGIAPITPSASNNKFALPAAGEEVLICSNPNCKKEVPGAKYGQKCPHCGIIWARESTAEVVASNAANPVGSSAPIVDPKNPFAKGPAPPGPAQAAMPPGPAPAPVVAAGAPPQGLTLETIPWWGKILGFGASIMVLMWALGRR